MSASELAAYEAQVRELAEQRDGKPIANGSIEHARILIKNLFMVAKNQVRLLTGQLEARFYGQDDLINEVKNFLAAPSRRLQILVEDEDAVSQITLHPLLSQIRDYQNVEIRAIPSNIRSHTRFHFAIADEDCFRFEKDTLKYAAFGAFGDKEFATPLISFFDQIWTKASKLPGTPPALHTA